MRNLEKSLQISVDNFKRNAKEMPTYYHGTIRWHCLGEYSKQKHYTALTLILCRNATRRVVM